MNKSDRIDAAASLLVEILKAQPNLLRPLDGIKSDGEALADFVETFIRRYSERLQALTDD